MARHSTKTSQSAPARYLMAMVLGTALSGLGSASVQASTAPSEAQLRAIADISRYCSVCWRNARLVPDCWQDCTQEVFCRLLERVDPDEWAEVMRPETEPRQEFFRAIDAVKKRCQRTKKTSALTDSIADYREGKDVDGNEELQQVRSTARECLSSRQFQILERSLEGWSVQEISKTLKIPAERVSDEKYKAVRKLRESLSA